MIMWQTASSKGDHHKTKELSGRVGMLIVNEEGNTISPTSFKQIVLVIDGTWTHEQISRMQRAGFDRIYYVDEIDTMKTELGL